MFPVLAIFPRRSRNHVGRRSRSVAPGAMLPNSNVNPIVRSSNWYLLYLPFNWQGLFRALFLRRIHVGRRRRHSPEYRGEHCRNPTGSSSHPFGAPLPIPTGASLPTLLPSCVPLEEEKEEEKGELSGLVPAPVATMHIAILLVGPRWKKYKAQRP